MPFNIHSRELLQPLIKVEEDAALAKEEYMESDMFFLEDELQYEGDIDCEKSLFELADCYDCGAVMERKVFSYDMENQQWLEGMYFKPDLVWRRYVSKDAPNNG